MTGCQVELDAIVEWMGQVLVFTLFTKPLLQDLPLLLAGIGIFLLKESREPFDFRKRFFSISCMETSGSLYGQAFL